MKRKRRSTILIGTLLCAFSLLLAACGNHNQALKLDYKATKPQTPGATMTSTVAGSPGTRGRTEYVAEVPDLNAWFALTSDGKNVVGFVTDGTPDRTPTIAQWYQGSVTNNNVQATPIAQASPGAQTTPGTQATATSTVEATPTAGGQGRLTAHLTQNAAIGTATLSNGKSFPFTANAITDPNSKSGLYYSTETINNTKYIAGWIIPPNATPSGTATPGATSTPTTMATETVTPAATETPTAGAPGSPTPSATGTATTGVNPSGGSAILDQQSGQLMKAPLPTAQDLAAQQISVPNLGMFRLKR